jgi:6-phosphogluconolactonase (cycloisomerase 2 family)
MNLRRYALALVAPLCLGLLLGTAHEAEAKKKKKKEFLYVHSNTGSPSTVYGYQVDKQGVLTALPGSPFSTGGDGTGCGGDCGTIAAAGKFVFVATNDGVAVLRIEKTGVLTPVPGSPFGGFPSYGVATARRGNNLFVFASDDGGPSVRGYEVAGNGTLNPVPGAAFTTGNGPVGVAANGRHVFVANQGADSVSTFSMAGNGTLTPVPASPNAVGTLFNIEADPNGSFVYVPDDSSGDVRGFRTDPATGALQALPGSPYGTNGVTANAGLAMSAGLVAYAVGRDGSGNNAQAFLKNANGQLTQLNTPVNLGIHDLNASALSANGALLAVAGDDGVATFRPNAATGALTAADSDLLAIPTVSGITFAKP